MVGFKSTILVFVFYLSHVFVMGHSLSNFMSSLWLIELILIFSFKFLYCYLPIPFFCGYSRITKYIFNLL